MRGTMSLMTNNHLNPENNCVLLLCDSIRDFPIILII